MESILAKKEILAPPTAVAEPVEREAPAPVSIGEDKKREEIVLELEPIDANINPKTIENEFKNRLIKTFSVSIKDGKAYVNTTSDAALKITSIKINKKLVNPLFDYV